jgi:hypothetical protein
MHAPERLREIYNDVCRTCGYENFLRIQGGARIERRSPEGEGYSQLTLLGDRIQLTEDHTGTSTEQFGKKVVAVLSAVLPALGIPLLLVQQNKVRATSTPMSFKTATEFLARRVFKIQPEQMEPLGRPTSIFGFRLVFPAHARHPENFNVRIESYVRDPQALYIENVGTFKTPIQSSTLPTVEDNLRITSAFISENILNFLSLYDRREAE